MSENLTGLVKVETESLNEIFPQVSELIKKHKSNYKKACESYMKDNPGHYVRCFPFFWKKKYISAEDLLKEDVDFHFGFFNDIPIKLINLGYVDKKDIIFCGEFWFGQEKLIGRISNIKTLVDNSTDGYVYLSPSSLEDITLIKRYLK